MNQDNTHSDEYQRKYRGYKVGTLKIFGGIQIGLGVLCGILSLVGIIIDGNTKSKGCQFVIDYSYGYSYTYRRCHDSYGFVDLFLGFDITCFVLSGWFLLTGMFPFCMNKHRQQRWRCLKITYMVMCIVGASIIVPTLFSLGVIGSIIRSEYEGGVAAVPGLIALFSFVEIIIAIVAASICCCCSSFEGSRDTTYVYVGTSQTSGGHILSMPNTPVQLSYTQCVQPIQPQGIPVIQGVMTQQQIPGGQYLQPGSRGIPDPQQPGSIQAVGSTEYPPPYKL